MRPWPAVVLAAMLVLAGSLSPGAAATATRSLSAPCSPALLPFAGAPTERRAAILGREDGVWHNQTIRVTPSDGVDCDELERFIDRTMARVEAIRELEFSEPVRVTLVSRRAFRQRVTDGRAPLPRRRFRNAKFEALFMINESTDAIAVTERNRATSVAAFYRPWRDEIVIVVDDLVSPRLDASTVAHELVHALQDQHLPAPADALPGANRGGTVGLVEGDASLVQARYERRCRRGPWRGSCVMPSSRTANGSSGDADEPLANLGPYLISYHPYSDGPSFVNRVRKRGGWDAVNDLYSMPPASSEQLIHPAAYPDDGPTLVLVTDRSGPAWHPIGFGRGRLSTTLGEDGLFAMFLYPSFATDGRVEIVDRSSFYTPGGLVDPYTYRHRYSAGWDGDRFVAYANDDGELGYVWKLAWDSPAEAREFRRGYRRLLSIHGATRVSPTTWRIPDGRPYGDAFAVIQRNETVVIVNAPSVAGLEAIRNGTRTTAG